MSYEVIETTDSRTFDVKSGHKELEGRIEAVRTSGDLYYVTQSSFSEYLTIEDVKAILSSLEKVNDEVEWPDPNY